MFGSQPQLKHSLREQRGQAFSSTRMQTGKNPYEQASAFTLNQIDGSIGSNLYAGPNEFSIKTMYNAAARAHSSLGISGVQNIQNDSFHNQLRLSQNLNSDQFLQMPVIAAQHQVFSSSMGFPPGQDPSQINDVFTTNPTLLLHQHNQCKADNKERLKKVRNLEDLINFKVTTIADHIQDQKEQLQESQFKPQTSELNSFNVVQMQSDNSINALKKMCDPLLQNGYYPKLLSKKATGLESQGDDKYQIPQSWLELKPNYSQMRVGVSKHHRKKLDKIVKQSARGKDTAKGGDVSVDDKTEEPERPESNESFQKNKERFHRDQENLRMQSEKIKREHEENQREQEERINKQRADKQIDPVKLLKDFFDSKSAQNQPSAKKQRAKTEMSQYESQESFKNQSQLKQTSSVHPNFVVAKYRKMKETGKLDKIDKQIQERQSHIELQNQYEQHIYLQNLSTYLAQKEAFENNIIKSQTQIQELEQIQGFIPATTNLNPDSRQGSADMIINDVGAAIPGVISNAPQNNNFSKMHSKFQNQPRQMFTEENDPKSRKDNISKMRSELRHIFNEDEANEEAANKAQKSKPISEITPSVMSPTALLERVDRLIDPKSHKTRLHTQNTNGNISNGQFGVTENKPGSRISNFMSFQRSSLASVGLGIRETEPVIVAPRDAVTHERVVRVVKNHQTFAPKRQYGQKVGALFTDMNKEEKQSFARHSELTKYQSVKTAGTSKSYVSYTDEQIKLAQKLKSMEQNQQKSLREVQQQLTAADNYSSFRDQQEAIEAEKKRQIKVQKIHEQHHASIGAISIDLRGSLPKIKHELEKKTEKSSVFGRKTFKEDEVEYSGIQDSHANEYSSITPIQISDYAMGPGTAMVSKQRTQNKFNAQAQKGKSQQFKRNARVTFHNKKPQHLLEVSDPNSPEINGRNIYLIPKGFDEQPLGLNQVPILAVQQETLGNGDDYDEMNVVDPNHRAAAVQAQSSSEMDDSKERTQTQEFLVNNSMGFVRVNDIAQISQQKGSFREHSDYNQKKPMLDLQKVDPQSSKRIQEDDQDTVKHKQDSALTTPITTKNMFGPDNTTGPTKVVSVLKSTDGIHESTIKMPQVEERTSERVDTEFDATKVQDPYGVQQNKNYESAKNMSFTSKSESPQPVPMKTPDQTNAEHLEVESTHGQASKTQGFILPSGRQDRVAIFSNQQSKPNLQNKGKDSQLNSVEQRSMLISDVPIEEKELTSDVIIRITKEEQYSSKETRDIPSKSIDDSKNQSLKNLAIIGESQKLLEHPVQKQISRDNGSKSSLRQNINQDIVQEGTNSKTEDKFFSKNKPSIPHLVIESNVQDSGIQSGINSSINLQNVHLKTKETMNAQFRRKKPTLDNHDRGYHSSTEPQMDQVSAELYDQIISDHLVRRGCWIPQRFKKFPRFTIFTQKEGTDDKNHLQNQFISLNPQVLALLAASDVTNIGQISTVLEEPAVTNRSRVMANQNDSQSPNREVKLETVIGQELLVQKTGQESNRTMKKEDTLASPQQKLINSRLASSNQQNYQGKNSQQRRSSQRASSQEPIDILNDLLGHDNDSQKKQQQYEYEQPQTTTKQFDPFDKVLLTKGIDNQILTSFRTLSKDNNMISNTLKVVHQRFFGQGANKAILSKVPKSKILYPLNKEIYDPEDHQNTLDNMTEQQKKDYASYLVVLSQIGLVDEEGARAHLLQDNSSAQVLSDVQRQIAIHGPDPLASVTSNISDIPMKMRPQGIAQDIQPTMNIIPSEQQMSAEQSNTFRINTNRTPKQLADQSSKVQLGLNQNQDDQIDESFQENQIIKIDRKTLSLKEKSAKLQRNPKVKFQRAPLAMGKVYVNQGQAYNSEKPYMVDGKSIKAIENQDEQLNRGQKKFHVKGSLPQVLNIAGRNVMQNSIIESRSGGGTRRGTSFSPDRRGTSQAYENLQGDSELIGKTASNVQEFPSPHRVKVTDSDLNKSPPKDLEQSKLDNDSKASVRVSEGAFKAALNTGGTTTQYGTLNDDKKINANRQSNQDKNIKIVKLNAPESLRQSKTYKKKDLIEGRNDQDNQKKMLENGKHQTASLESIDKHNILTLGTNNANISRQEEQFYSSQKGKNQLPHMQVEVKTNSSRGPSPDKELQNLAIHGTSHLLSPGQRQEMHGGIETIQNIKQDQLRKTSNKFSGGFQMPKSKMGTQYTEKTVTPNNKSDKQDMLIQETNTIDQQERDALLRKTDMVQVLSILTQQAHGSSLEQLQRILIETQKQVAEEDKQQSLINTNKEQNTENNKANNKNQGQSQSNYNPNTGHHQIKKMIDEIYSREKKYQKKQIDRDDLLQTNDMIFDLSKAHELNSMNIQQQKPVVSSDQRHFKHPHIWNRPQALVQRGHQGFIAKQRLEKSQKQHSVSPSQVSKEILQPDTLQHSPQVSASSVPRAKDQNIQLIVEGQTPVDNSDWVTPSQLKAITSALKTSERQAISNNKYKKKIGQNNQGAQSNKAEVAVGEQGGDYQDPVTQRGTLLSRDAEIQGRNRMASGATNRLGTGNSTNQSKISPRNSQGGKLEEIGGVQIQVSSAVRKVERK